MLAKLVTLYQLDTLARGTEARNNGQNVQE